MKAARGVTATAVYAATAIVCAAACSPFSQNASDPPVDAGGGSDAQSDAPSGDGGGRPAVFCENSKADFCWSFETAGGGALDGGPSFTFSGDTTLANDAKSAPAAMRAVVEAEAGAPGDVESVLLLQPTVKSHVLCEADIAVDALGLGSNTVFPLSVAAGGVFGGFALNGAGGTPTLSLYYALNNQPLADVPLGGYQHLTLDAKLVGSELTMTATAAGVTKVHTATLTEPFSPMSIKLGAKAFGEAHATVRVDNIECRYDK